MPLGTVAVTVAIVPRKQPFEQLHEVGLGSGAGLHDGEAGGGVGREDVEQPVTTTLTEPGDLVGQVDHLAPGGVDGEHGGGKVRVRSRHAPQLAIVGQVAWTPVSPRIAVELTSERPDGTWTWRAAGARQPKGVLDGKLLPAGARIGDVVRAEADFDLEGITVTTVLAPKGERREPKRLEVLGTGRDDPSVTTNLRRSGSEDEKPSRRPPPDAGRRGGRSDARPAGERAREGGRERQRPSTQRPSTHRPSGRPTREAGDERREHRSGRPRVEAPSRPRPKKLRPGRAHRQELMRSLPQEQQPIAEQVIRGGMPAVRAALEEQNAAARAQGKPEAPTAAVLAIAEGLLPRVRLAEWLDRADAAMADVEELALADLRSVVVSADDVSRAEQTRELAAKLKEVLERRTEAEHAEWLRDLTSSLDNGRVVRALRLSSRSPRTGERLDPEVATRLAEAAGTAMTADIPPERWGTVLDAVAYSAVRRSVTPAGVPPEPGDDLLAQVRKHAGRVPAIAHLFGVEPPAEVGDGRRRPARSQHRRRAATAPAGAAGAQGPAPRARRIPPPPTTAPPAGADAVVSSSADPEPEAEGKAEQEPEVEAVAAEPEPESKAERATEVEAKAAAPEAETKAEPATEVEVEAAEPELGAGPSGAEVGPGAGFEAAPASGDGSGDDVEDVMGVE